MSEVAKKVLYGFPEQIWGFLKGKRGENDAKKPDHFLRLNPEALVDGLTARVQQLQKNNLLLKGRTGKLKDYSRKLETLLDVIINLQLSNSPNALRETLVNEICTKFPFDRCAFLEVDYEQMLLKITDTCGFGKSDWGHLKIPYEMPVFQRLFQEEQVLFFNSPNKIPDLHIKNILKQINARKFLFGILGTPLSGEAQFSAENNLREMLAGLIPTLEDQKDTDIDIIREHLQEYFSSDIFYFGGYLFLDYKNASKRFTRYDVKILEMLLRTAGLLYQNLQMRKQLQEFFIRAEKDAITDYLTGLYNFRYFSHQVKREFHRAQRHQSQFALLMLDIDFFKSYNDTFGHQAGDLVLKKIAKLFLENTRGSDFVARYGGEEFAIICPELTKIGGKKIAEKLCKIVANTPFPRENQLPQKKVTISIGVAAYPGDGQSAAELIRHADAALYRAKQNGRKRVELY